MRYLCGLLLILVLAESAMVVVFADPNVVWSHILPSGLSEQTGTLSADSRFIMIDGVIALGTAPCPAYWRCPDSWNHPQTFWALDVSSGNVRWTIPLENGSTIEPIAAEKFIFAQYARPNDSMPGGLTTYRTLALDPQTGRIVWSIPGSSWTLAGNLVLTSIEKDYENVSSHEWVITDATLSAYDASTGTLRWTIDTLPHYYPFSFTRDSSYGAGTLFTIGHEGTDLFSQDIGLYALNASTAQVKWVRKGFAGFASCPTYDDGMIFATQWLQGPSNLTSTVNLVALDAISGRTNWNKTLGYSYYDTRWNGENPYIQGVCPIMGKDRIFSFSIQNFNQLIPDLVAYSDSDGRELWRQPVPCEVDPIDLTSCRPVMWNQLAVSESLIFLSSGYLHAIDQNTGREVWDYGLTVDNWNPLTYENSVLYALNTPNGVAPPTINALAFHELPVPDLSTRVVVSILATTVLATILLMRMTRTITRFRKRARTWN